MQPEEGQIVRCTVEKIVGTTIFVKIEDNGEGTITTSEIAPGRIRNLRDYVVPGKIIICKVLSIKGKSTHLSLRRVKQNEKKELMDRVEKERSYKAILKTVLGEKHHEVIEKITLDYDLIDFFEKVKQNREILEKYLNPPDAEKVLKILETKKEKPKEIKQIIRLSSRSPQGIVTVKNIIKTSCQDSKCNVSYLAAGKYSLGILGNDFKEIKFEITKVLDSIESQAKKQSCEFSLEKK
jgi:translation initiation factor 2 alpha subunit (eIF-2alpha)